MNLNATKHFAAMLLIITEQQNEQQQQSKFHDKMFIKRDSSKCTRLDSHYTEWVKYWIELWINFYLVTFAEPYSISVDNIAMRKQFRLAANIFRAVFE